MKFFNTLALVLVLSCCFALSPIYASVVYKQAVEKSVVPKKEKRAKHRVRLQSKRGSKLKKKALQHRKQWKITNKPSMETKLGRFFLVAGVICIFVSITIFAALITLPTIAPILGIIFTLFGIISGAGAVIFPIASIIFFAIGIAIKED